MRIKGRKNKRKGRKIEGKNGKQEDKRTGLTEKA